MITREEALNRLQEILNKGNKDGGERPSGSSNIDDNKVENAKDVIEAGDNSGDRLNSHKVEDYQAVFGGDVSNVYLLGTRQMTRKEYLNYSKGLSQKDVLEHPLLYCMFRSEGQGEGNFFEWLSRFKK
jgi:hypothetical protein